MGISSRNLVKQGIGASASDLRHRLPQLTRFPLLDQQTLVGGQFEINGPRRQIQKTIAKRNKTLCLQTSGWPRNKLWALQHTQFVCVKPLGQPSGVAPNQTDAFDERAKRHGESTLEGEAM